MKKLTLILPILGLAATGLSSCNNANVIRVGATPTPHSEVLKSKIVQDYIANAGYKLKVVVYQDYKTPNKALNDGGIDANYFQHIPYLEGEVEEFGYKITAVAKVHCEPLSLYSKTPIEDFTNKTINIISDLTNLERAKAGLGSLALDNTLSAMANIRAQEIVEKWAHERPDGTNVTAIAREYNYSYRVLGENLAKGQTSEAQAVAEWMYFASDVANMDGDTINYIYWSGKPKSCQHAHGSKTTQPDCY